MSTILNALKRLEDERRAEAGKQIPASMAGRTSVSRRNRRWRLVFVLAGLAMLAGAAVFWVYTDRSSSKSAPLEAAQPEPRTETASRESTRAAPSAAPIPSGRRPEVIPKTTGRRGRRASKSTTQALVNAKADLTAPTYVPPDPEGKSIQGRSPKPTPEGPAVMARPGPAAPPLPQEDLYANAEVLPKDTLQLQAISWSDIPGDRITIITGQILREGQAIEGYGVIAIRPDDVILEKDGKRWKLVYSSH